eukprot:CAMPEP_0179184870 /NCGR_PEP_ID=MMETSP0796-20121207/91665_1 /TAXON_ID=73915 /ORGANISM="Pyrodinium bahamense, Strain pbaha01" /LENGTH=132 /DNA_ID=CAMNT_0020888819 /DNA_START=99 /DNA_END=494 /DNA_ORIENTATION=-
MTCFLGLALGPTTSLFDFLKGFFTTALASLIVQRPNFTQFGELSDYVYCTFCAVLYIERVAEDQRREHDAKELHEEAGVSAGMQSLSARGAFLQVPLPGPLPLLLAALCGHSLRGGAASGHPESTLRVSMPG